MSSPSSSSNSTASRSRSARMEVSHAHNSQCSTESDSESSTYSSSSRASTPSTSPRLTPMTGAGGMDFINPIPPRRPTLPLSRAEDPVQLEFLVDRPEFLEAVAQALWHEWEYIYSEVMGISNLEAMVEWVSDNHLHRDQLNSTVIAVIDGKLACMAMLVTEDCMPGDVYYGVTPWITSVYVLPEFRGRGLANLLISRMSDRAQEMGYRHCWLITQTMQDAYAKLGYRAIEETPVYGSIWTVMRKTFCGPNGEPPQIYTLADARASHAKFHSDKTAAVNTCMSPANSVVSL